MRGREWVRRGAEQVRLRLGHGNGRGLNEALLRHFFRVQPGSLRRGIGLGHETRWPIRQVIFWCD